MRHVLTRAVGAESHVEAEITVHPLSPDDLLLLCTDGLTKMIDDQDIRHNDNGQDNTVVNNGGSSPAVKANAGLQPAYQNIRP